VLLGAAGEGLAQPTTVPPGLAPGVEYRLVFVTSQARNATSSDIAGYNSFVTGVAAAVPELVALGTRWKAIACTGSVNARDNTGTDPVSDPDGVPIYRLNGDRLASGNADLWDASLAGWLSLDEYGVYVGLRYPWTGCESTGQSSVNPLGAPHPVLGSTNDTQSGWIYTNTGNSADAHPLYAMSDVLRVPWGPIPSISGPGLALLFGALLGIGGWWSRTRV